MVLPLSQLEMFASHKPAPTFVRPMATQVLACNALGELVLVFKDGVVTLRLDNKARGSIARSFEADEFDYALACLKDLVA